MNEIMMSIAASLSGLVFVSILVINMLKQDQGDDKVKELSMLIQKGATAFMKREYMYVSVVVIIITIVIVIAPFINSSIGIDYRTAIAFVFGAVVSGLAGYIAMWVGTRANGRTTEAASRGLIPAIRLSFTAGATTGLTISSISLMGLTVLFLIYKGSPQVLNGYAMGASLLALFARAGGGIYTKAADMGADLVGKVEAGIPEDDPRNAAVIADNVGDNVGDTAGLGADLMESYVESIIATMAIGVTVGNIVSLTNAGQLAQKLVALPLLLASIGLFASIAGVIWVLLGLIKKPQNLLNSGVYLASALMIIGSFIAINIADINYEGFINKMAPFYAIVSGLAAGLIIAFVSEYYSSSKYRPVRELAESAESGPAIVVVNGLALGMKSTMIPVSAIVIAMIAGFEAAGMYGIALAALGMLSTLGITLAVDSYGPVVDNAGGIAEMSHQDKNVREITDELDSVGNTTAAIGKGFAIGSAAFAALGLITAYITTVLNSNGGASDSAVNLFSNIITDPYFIGGLLFGGMIPYFMSSLLAGGVGKVAFKIIAEVRRQFRDIAGLMEGTAEPETEKCVEIAADGAIKYMLGPGLLALLTPVAVGFIFGPITLAGVLIGSLITGVQLGIQTANSGAAMDNAKKYIEEGNVGGKNTDAHRAAIVGDTVGDPLKDTIGPSINILIKLMSIIALVIAPIIIQFCILNH
ncbi:MAG: sodium-translocating pyrophosphatase [candidate division WOR-3 bacterium]|nr:sodium-translocating pyrophosphatase [candidate division WOR-3 bacterium]